MELEKGKSSSEFLVALLIVLPWVCNSMGIDLQQLAPFLSAAMGVDLSSAAADAGRIRETIEAANRQTNAPVWVGLAYVAGRPALKAVYNYFKLRREIAGVHSTATV